MCWSPRIASGNSLGDVSVAGCLGYDVLAHARGKLCCN